MMPMAVPAPHNQHPVLVEPQLPVVESQGGLARHGLLVAPEVLVGGKPAVTTVVRGVAATPVAAAVARIAVHRTTAQAVAVAAELAGRNLQPPP